MKCIKKYWFYKYPVKSVNFCEKQTLLLSEMVILRRGEEGTDTQTHTRINRLGVGGGGQGGGGGGCSEGWGGMVVVGERGRGGGRRGRINRL